MVSDTEQVSVALARPRRRRRGFALLVAVLAASALVLAAAWLYASPYFVLQQFKSAAAGASIAGMRAWAEASVADERLGAVASVAQAGQFEAGYEGLSLFAVRVRSAQPGEPVLLRFRRVGLMWRLIEVQGAAMQPAKPAEPAPAAGQFAQLVRAGMPAAEFLSLDSIRGRTEKLLGPDLASLKQNLASSPGVQVEPGELFVSGCAPNACKSSEAALAVDTGSGDVNAAVLKDGRLTIYSATVSVLEELPAGMQRWMDHLASDENAAIPVSFHQ